MSGLTLEDLPRAAASRASRRREDRRQRGRQRRTRTLVVLLAALLAFTGGAVLAWDSVTGLVADLTEPDDFTGEGTGEVQVRIEPGDTGSAIARTLAGAGVVKSEDAFVRAVDAEPRAAGLQPGLYALRSRMSAASALALLLDPAARQAVRVTVPEGFTAAQTLARLAELTGRPVEELQAAAADPAVGLPPAAGGQLEGYLFPATYDFDPETGPAQMLAAMVARNRQAMDALAVPEGQRHEVLTRASIVQAEAGGTTSPDDMAKVARVLQNRLDVDQPLQLDTTVNYATGKTGITTTAEDRSSDSPYNTYKVTGLPPGPISNPGEAAIQAVLSPADGPWRWFVVVDPDTGETRFAETDVEHAENVELFRAWLRENG